MNIFNKNREKNKITNGEIITKIINNYISKYNFTNILFVRTPTTGNWLDKIGVNNNNIIRIIYDTDFITGINSSNINNKINYNNLENILLKLNKKFNLICLDPYHDYEISKSNFNLLYSYLTDDGTMISHDCFPTTVQCAYPKYFEGDWCGETYIAFVEFAYNNPTLYYAILNIDTGIGIISKSNKLTYLINHLNNEKQKLFISMKKNNKLYTEIYQYFFDNSKELINSINL